jgi:hypothetical protein
MWLNFLTRFILQDPSPLEMGKKKDWKKKDDHCNKIMSGIQNQKKERERSIRKVWALPTKTMGSEGSKSTKS